MTPAGLNAMRADVMISRITIWELTRKAAIGKLAPLPVEGGSFARHLAALGFQTHRYCGAMPKSLPSCRRITGTRWIAC